MTKYLISFLLIFALVSTSFIMDGGKKAKIKFKDGFVLVDGEKWGKIETIIFGNKYSLSTLSDKEYMVLSFESVKTGEYSENGKEKTEAYVTIKFLGAEIDLFEMNSNRKSVVRALIDTEVISEGKFIKENALKFKEKYEEDISSKYKKEETIIIIK